MFRRNLIELCKKRKTEADLFWVIDRITKQGSNELTDSQWKESYPHIIKMFSEYGKKKTWSRRALDYVSGRAPLHPLTRHKIKELCFNEKYRKEKLGDYQNTCLPEIAEYYRRLPISLSSDDVLQ